MTEYLTVKQLSTKCPAFSEASLRYHIFNARTNGLEKAIFRIGKKILFNEALFLSWIEEQKISRFHYVFPVFARQ